MSFGGQDLGVISQVLKRHLIENLLFHATASVNNQNVFISISVSGKYADCVSEPKFIGTGGIFLLSCCKWLFCIQNQ